MSGEEFNFSYVTNKFPEDYVPTVFENYVAKAFYHDETYELELWDSAGQEAYARLRNLSYPSSDAVLLVFSVIEPISFDNALKKVASSIFYKKWLPEIKENAPHAVVVFVGNKIDLRSDNSTGKKAHLQYESVEAILY